MGVDEGEDEVGRFSRIRDAPGENTWEDLQRIWCNPL